MNAADIKLATDQPSKVTIEEYGWLMEAMLASNPSVYVASTVATFGALVDAIEAVNEAHPDYEDRWCASVKVTA